MVPEGAFTVAIVGSREDLRRLRESTDGEPGRFQLELAGPDDFDAVVARSPDVAVIGAEVDRPLPVARRIRDASPQSELLFLLPSERMERFRATLPFVPKLASAWTVSTDSGTGTLAGVLADAASAARRKASSEAVLGRINRAIASRRTQPEEVRRSQLVLSERYLATILTQSPDAFLAVNPAGTVIACNDSAIAKFGAGIEGGNIADSEFLPEDQRTRVRELVGRASRGETLFEEIRFAGRQDEQEFAELSFAPVHHEDGVIASVSVTARDITERKRYERHQQLLIAELNHRVKNTLAIVQSVAHQTFTRDKPPRDAIDAYEGRLTALAAAHNLLTRQNWESASLADVVTQALKPFCREKRCSWQGPELKVPPRIAVTLTLALHELATNAQKYGALSEAGGAIEVNWEIDGGQLELQWTEVGGPPVAEPTTTGFGTRMLRRALVAELSGTVDMEFNSDGLVCRIRAPLDGIG